MQNLIDIAEFVSVKFEPILPEHCQVNPRVYGAELAYWLCPELAKSGIAASYPQNEDWGWYIEFITESGSEFAVHIGNVFGTKDRWLISLRRYGRKIFGRKKPSISEAESLLSGIKQILESEPSISDLKWLLEN
jgi:hypothetical protein